MIGKKLNTSEALISDAIDCEKYVQQRKEVYGSGEQRKRAYCQIAEAEDRSLSPSKNADAIGPGNWAIFREPVERKQIIRVFIVIIVKSRDTRTTHIGYDEGKIIRRQFTIIRQILITLRALILSTRRQLSAAATSC